MWQTRCAEGLRLPSRHMRSCKCPLSQQWVPLQRAQSPRHLRGDTCAGRSGGSTEKAEVALLALHPEGREALSVLSAGYKQRTTRWSQCPSSPPPDSSWITSRVNLPLVLLHLFSKSFSFLLQLLFLHLFDCQLLLLP